MQPTIVSWPLSAIKKLLTALGCELITVDSDKNDLSLACAIQIPKKVAPKAIADFIATMATEVVVEPFTVTNDCEHIAIFSHSGVEYGICADDKTLLDIVRAFQDLGGSARGDADLQRN